MAWVPELTTLIVISSSILKLVSYVFLRWIPGHHAPPVVWSSFLAYVTCFYFEVASWPKKALAEERATISDKRSSSRRFDSSEPPHGSRKGNAPLFAAFLGVPSRNRPIANRIGFALHTVLFVMVTDLVYRGPLLYTSSHLSFVRVGYVDSQSAKLLVREPDQSKVPVTLTYHESDSSWKQQSLFDGFSNATDFVQPVLLEHLRPNADYKFYTSSGHNGTFRTAPKSGQTDPKLDKFTFITTSCIKAHFPYNPLDHPLVIPGFEYLAATLPRLKASFMLFLGDFIYIDAPHRIGSDVSTYRNEYRRVYASPSWPPVSSLPWLHVIDDHEIENDWDQGDAPPYPAAVDPFTHYHHAGNPPAAHPNATYYAFAQGPASFFLLDTRRYRMPSGGLPNRHPGKSMLGAEQLAAVRAWLAAPEPKGVRWKVLVSSVPFTRNWRVNADDTWGGYLAERQILLEAMWDAASGKNAFGVIVLSGDRHEFAATRFPAPPAKVGSEQRHGWKMVLPDRSSTSAPRWVASDGKPAVVHEFSCSPLSMFYLPFRSYKEKKGETAGVGTGGEDQQVAYLPDGNSKFGAIDMWQEGNGVAKMQYTLFVDGKDTWRTTLTSGHGHA